MTRPIEPVGGSQPVRPSQRIERRPEDEREDERRRKRKRERKPERPAPGDGAPHVDVLA